MKYLICVLIGYLIGTINPSYIIAKIRGFDIREKGSKNAGASNALILFGKVLGVACALFDIAKATSFGHSKYEGRGSEFEKDSDFSPYSEGGILAIDACTAYSQKVNCIVIED